MKDLLSLDSRIEVEEDLRLGERRSRSPDKVSRPRRSKKRSKPKLASEARTRRKTTFKTISGKKKHKLDLRSELFVNGKIKDQELLLYYNESNWVCEFTNFFKCDGINYLFLFLVNVKDPKACNLYP